MQNTTPEIILEYLHSPKYFPFLKVQVIVEDRKTEDLSKKYKHMISVALFGATMLSCSIRSASEGIYYFD